MSLNIQEKNPVTGELKRKVVAGNSSNSGLPVPEAKDKLLLSTENTETSELEWSQIDKYKAVEIPLYETKAAAEADIANLSEGQIIATKDDGNENAKPVDVVESGNMHAVTSNAVADSLDGLFENITDYVVGDGYKFVGTVIKIGKFVFVDGKVTNTIQDNQNAIIKSIPVNRSGVNKDLNVIWLSSDYNSIVGRTVLSFDVGSTTISPGIGRSPLGSTQISFSYIN